MNVFLLAVSTLEARKYFSIYQKIEFNKNLLTSYKQVILRLPLITGPATDPDLGCGMLSSSLGIA